MMNFARFAHAGHNASRGGAPNFRGSMEGLKNGRRADIQMNGVGYNKAKNASSTVTNVPGMKSVPMRNSGGAPRNQDYTNKISTRRPKPRLS